MGHNDLGDFFYQAGDLQVIGQRHLAVTSATRWTRYRLRMQFPPVAPSDKPGLLQSPCAHSFDTAVRRAACSCRA